MEGETDLQGQSITPSQFDAISDTEKNSELSETFQNIFNSTLNESQDSLNSTIMLSQMDATYDESVQNDSITKAKTVAKSNRKAKNKQKQNKTKKQRNKETKNTPNDVNGEIVCIDACTNDTVTESIRCNLCMNWFHTDCVGISDMDSVGAWVCADCRKLPETVKIMKSQIEILLDSTMSISENINSFSKNLENKFENLNDRLTVISNQQKRSDLANTSSFSDIRQDITSLKTDVDKKTNSILSKSQSLFDKVKASSEIIKKVNDSEKYVHSTQNEKKNQTKQIQNQGNKPPLKDSSQNQGNKSPVKDSNHKSKQQSTEQTTEKCVEGKDDNTNQLHCTDDLEPKQLAKRDLTFITGSSTLKSIETKYLAENVRVKHLKNAKIDSFKEALARMDLSRYKNLVIHIGEHDIDDKISQSVFREKYKSLLSNLTEQGCKLYVSGFLPRGKTNVKPFNDILKHLCQTHGIQFIENHDSFILASGDLPYDFFYADKINLKFAGTRALVHSINSQCMILPKRNNGSSHNPFENRFGPKRGAFSNQNYRGNRNMPIWIN